MGNTQVMHYELFDKHVWIIKALLSQQLVGIMKASITKIASIM